MKSGSSARSRAAPTPISSGWSSASSTPRCSKLSHDHWFGDQIALEALVRFSDEELKHQALFRRIDAMVGEVLPAGYRFDVDPNGVAHAVLGKSTWAVLALTLDIELFTQLHYRQSIDPDTELSELFKDVFLYHWKEESQHAILDELEWVRHDAGLTAEQRDRAVDEFIELVAAVDGVLQAQAKADAGYFVANVRPHSRATAEARAIEAAFLKAYRWQYIHSGAQHPQLRQGALQPDHRKPGPAHSGSARHAPMSQPRTLTNTQAKEVYHGCPDKDRRTQRRQRHQRRRSVCPDRRR